MNVSGASLREWGRDFAISLVAGVFVGVIGPFGSFQNGGVGIRIGYWAAMLCAGTMIYRATMSGARWTSRRLALPFWVAFSATVIVAAAPMALVSRITATSLWPFLAGRLTPLDWYLQCVVLGLPLCAGYELLDRHGRTARSEPSPGPPARFSRDVICLQMEDHYVRAHTAQGSALHLMTLSEAIGRTARPGLQVHRSWWVARDAVSTVLHDGRSVRLKLLNGLEVPVARRSVTHLKAAGLAPD
jgi:hypothetical protein